MQDQKLLPDYRVESKDFWIKVALKAKEIMLFIQKNS
jgi:hypothetical protein